MLAPPPARAASRIVPAAPAPSLFLRAHGGPVRLAGLHPLLRSIVGNILANRDVVKVIIAKRGIDTTVTIDRDVSCFSVTLLVSKGTEANLTFDTWAGSKKPRTFKV